MSVAIQDAEGDYGAVIISGAYLAISANVIDNPATWDHAAVLLLQNEVPESWCAYAAKPIVVVSTHGAGDVFSGVFCAELAHDTPLNSGISIANDAAGDHVTRQ